MKLFLSVLLITVTGSAQDEPPVFTTSTNSVVVDAAVIGDPSASTGLQRDDFTLSENGQPITIAGIAHDQLPLDIVLVCQAPLQGFPRTVHVNPRGDGTDILPGTSEVINAPPSFADKRQNIPQRLMNAAANAIVGMRLEDRVAIVTYGKDPHIALRFTGDRKALAAAIKRFGDPDRAEENIVLSSEGLAIEYAVRLLADVERSDPNSRTNRRRLIVMISNVLGSGTRYADEPVIRRLWEQDIVFSVIEDFPASQATKTIQRAGGGEAQTVLFQRYNPVHIAQATGGDRSVPMDPQHPPDLLSPIRQRYTLWFNQPSNVPAGETRTIKVDLSEAARRRFPEAVVRAREGYVTR